MRKREGIEPRYEQETVDADPVSIGKGNTREANDQGGSLQTSIGRREEDALATPILLISPLPLPYTYPRHS